MTYNSFIENIGNYVGCVMEFTGTLRATGEKHKFQRYVWDSKEFGKLRSDSLVSIEDVAFVRKAETRRTPTGINYIV